LGNLSITLYEVAFISLFRFGWIGVMKWVLDRHRELRSDTRQFVLQECMELMLFMPADYCAAFRHLQIQRAEELRCQKSAVQKDDRDDWDVHVNRQRNLHNCACGFTEGEYAASPHAVAHICGLQKRLTPCKVILPPPEVTDYYMTVDHKVTPNLHWLDEATEVLYGQPPWPEPFKEFMRNYKRDDEGVPKWNYVGRGRGGGRGRGQQQRHMRGGERGGGWEI